jgi:DNA-binding IclR family transcriptional regulator
VAMPHLNELRDRTSLSCHLSIREQSDSVYLYRACRPAALGEYSCGHAHCVSLHRNGSYML